MNNRNPFVVFLLGWLTFGIYPIVWLVQTKKEMNELGACIPTAWLLLIPFANLYWLWRYCEGAEEITDGKASAISSFALLVVLGPIGMAISQSYYNKVKNYLAEGDIQIVQEGNIQIAQEGNIQIAQDGNIRITIETLRA